MAVTTINFRFDAQVGVESLGDTPGCYVRITFPKELLIEDLTVEAEEGSFMMRGPDGVT